MRLSVILPVYAPTPFLRAMTEFCVKALREGAKQPFELVIVEAGVPISTLADLADKYIAFETRTGNIGKEFNVGCNAASGDYLVHAGNDVIAGEGWDDALLEPFDTYQDCGLSALAAAEAGAYIGPVNPVPLIVEGMYTPFMCFPRHWRLDESYPRGCFSDSDLVMRVYALGQRAYRNARAHVFHLNHVTLDLTAKNENEACLQLGGKLFYERWRYSPYLIYGLIRNGHVIYGREHEAIAVPAPAGRLG